MEEKNAKLDQEIDLEPILNQLAVLPQLDLEVSDDTRSQLPAIAGGLSVALAATLKTIEPELKAPAPGEPETNAQAPSYTAPTYTAPTYSAPIYSAPIYTAPIYTAPIYLPPIYLPPISIQPIIEEPGSAPAIEHARPIHIPTKEVLQDAPHHAG